MSAGRSPRELTEPSGRRRLSLSGLLGVIAAFLLIAQLVSPASRLGLPDARRSDRLHGISEEGRGQAPRDRTDPVAAWHTG